MKFLRFAVVALLALALLTPFLTAGDADAKAALALAAAACKGAPAAAPAPDCQCVTGGACVCGPNGCNCSTVVSAPATLGQVVPAPVGGGQGTVCVGGSCGATAAGPTYLPAGGVPFIQAGGCANGQCGGGVTYGFAPSAPAYGISYGRPQRVFADRPRLFGGRIFGRARGGCSSCGG